MREDLLHFVWKYKKLQLEDLFTSKGETVTILDVGFHNYLAGPDFFNAKVKIHNQVWAGNVEIHLKSSDWYAHGHEKDPSYNNVILHVVWEDDIDIFRKDNSELPTLELRSYITTDVIQAYKTLFDKKDISYINCEREIGKIDSFLLGNWLERLYFERLEQKSDLVKHLMARSKNDWEQVLFLLLLKNFGSKINGDSFLSIGKAVDFSIVRKISQNAFQLESVLMGLAGLLQPDSDADLYHQELKKEYRYLQNKFNLTAIGVQQPDFFKLRPLNFPTIRLSQLANLYAKQPNLFSQIIEASTLDAVYDIFQIEASSYWTTHFTFGKSSGKNKKKLTKSFVDLIVINTILPLKFCYGQETGTEVNEDIVKIISGLKKERNRVILNFEDFGVNVKSAMDSQAILQLFNAYCSKNKCLQCAIGTRLLNGNS
ncbi:DUF2851 family protein [Spongiimicrobium sp. 3-5]|uniref:DUF2851 family protein n=1 Tax=Spongiimicrobium sp. 3-5 TaxID=3332596 RepID=UPI00397F1A0D